MRDIRVAAVQFNHAAGDKRYNLDRVRHFVGEAARAKVEILVFPEMCLTGYWHVRKLSGDALAALAAPVPDRPTPQEVGGHNGVPLGQRLEQGVGRAKLLA